MFSPENKRYLHLLPESRRNCTLSCLVISQRWCTWIRGQWHGSPDKPPSSNKRHVRHLVGDTFSEFRLTSTTPRVLRGIRAFPPKVQSEMGPQSATTALVRVRSCAGGSIRNSDKDDVIFASPWLVGCGGGSPIIAQAKVWKVAAWGLPEAALYGGAPRRPRLARVYDDE